MGIAPVIEPVTTFTVGRCGLSGGPGAIFELHVRVWGNLDSGRWRVLRPPALRPYMELTAAATLPVKSA